MEGKAYSRESKIKDVMRNPIGKDIIIKIFQAKNINSSNVLVKNIKLKQLIPLSKGIMDDAFIDTICNKLNDYESQRLPKERMTIEEKWWKEVIAYQIYPRSFYDSNNDGIGDLKGIISKLDYLKDLGIDLIWLSPIYDSPNDDNGYDIRDYRKIMDEFGDMDDFDLLLHEVHKRDMRLIMDLVINHTSDEHDWFVSAKADKNSPYRDYYFWRKGKGEDISPNNWDSLFSGSAWIYDEKSDEWYLHLFSSKQVDLNWENKKLRKDIYNMINWWLDKGIDGFRLDVISFISKEEGLPNGSQMIGKTFGIKGAEHYFFGPKIHEYLQEMNDKTFSNYDVVTVGETPGTGMEMSKYFTHDERNELNMIFNFDHLEMPGKGKFDDYEYDLNYLKEIMIKWQTGYSNNCWNSLFYNNHDNPRMLSKIAKDMTYRKELGKLLALIQLTLKGTPYIYQGQEIGMVNTTFDSIDDFRDVESINLYYELKEKGLKSEDEILDMLRCGSRDNARVPIQWTDDINGGFSQVTPWIKVNEDYRLVNVENELKKEDSIINFYKTLIKIRKENIALIYGEFIPVHPNKKDLFIYYRELDGEKFLIEANISKVEQKSFVEKNEYDLILSNYPENVKGKLRPFECSLYKC